MKATRLLRDATIAAIAIASAAAYAEDRAPLCPSVLMFDEASWARAPERVNRAAALLAGAADDAKWVQLFPTIHVELNEQLQIKRFGLRKRHDQSWESPDNFVPVKDAAAFRQRLSDQLSAAIEQAVYRGLNVSIVPHLDSAGPIQSWRNQIDFDPLASHAGASYRSLLLEAIVEAIERSANTDTRIDFALSGEMGRSWFSHPTAYEALITQYRTRLAGKPSAGRLRLGAALNWTDVAGELSPQDVDKERTPRLFAACDFIAFSCYAPVSESPVAEDFRIAVLNTRRELASFGARLEGRPLLISEVGIGGGNPTTGSKFASVTEASKEPWQGIGSGHIPWRHPELAALRQGFHAALCEHLATATGLSRVERAHLWSEGPWDPQGVTESGQRDDAISELISRHNAR